MFGIGVGSTFTFPAALERELQKRTGGHDVEVLNFGAPGSSAVDVSSILLTEVASSQPDIVIYGYVLNDIDLGSFLDTRAYFDGIGIKPDNLRRIIESHELGGLRKHIRVFHYLIGRYEDRMLDRLILDMYSKSYEPRRNPGGLKRLNKDFSMITEYYSERGIPVILMIYPILVNLDSDYPFAATHARVAETGRADGMKTLDLLPYYKGKKSALLWVSRTDHHPNREGQKIAAVAAADFIVKNNFFGSAWRNQTPVAPKKSPGKSITESEYVNKANDALRRGDPDTALLLVAQAIEENPGDCDLHELAANIILARGAPRAAMHKINRMKYISRSCGLRAKTIESKANKMFGGISIQ